MSGESAMADFFGPPALQSAVAGESLSMAALRVAVGAPRDGELRALAVELAATRRAHVDLTVHNAMLQQQVDTTEALNTENRRLRRRLENSERDMDFMRYEATRDEETRNWLNRKLALGADVLARWVARREGRMPVEVWEAILLMRRQDVAEVDSDNEGGGPA
jgi:hypothetical protein